MHRLRTLAASLLLCAPWLVGCGGPPIVTEAPRLVVPATLKSCPAQPDAPADGSDDATLARWIVGLADAGQACRDTLSELVGAIGQ